MGRSKKAESKIGREGDFGHLIMWFMSIDARLNMEWLGDVTSRAATVSASTEMSLSSAQCFM